MALDFFEKLTKSPFLHGITHFCSFLRFAKKLLVQHMHFQAYSLREFNLQYLKKNRNLLAQRNPIRTTYRKSLSIRPWCYTPSSKKVGFGQNITPWSYR